MEKTTKSPAFQFYVQDFLSGVKFFSAEETGAYILLLCEQWDSGFIENNEKILKKITGISPKKLQKVLEKFEKKENKFINKRLHEEKVKREEFITKSRLAGEESAKKRAEEKARSVGIGLQPKGNSSLSSSLSSSTSKEKTTTELFVDEESTIQNPENDFSSKGKETAFTESINAEPPKPKKEKGAGAQVVPKEPSVYAQCIEVYNQFVIQRTGVPGKFDGQEGKAMKAIIAYLASVSNEKTDQGTINSWRHILTLIEKWDPYHRNQLKISQINSNLINIVNSIKNGTAKQSANNYDNKYRTSSANQGM